jgi:LysM repeat protein
MAQHKAQHKRSLRHNIRPGVGLLVVPLLVGITVVTVLFSGMYSGALGRVGDNRLVTQNWETAEKAFTDRQPSYERKFAYYKVKEGQTLEAVAAYFSVDTEKLAALNPGTIVAGTTIKIPPLEHPYAPVSGPNGKLSTAVVQDDQGLLRIRQAHRLEQAVTTIPDLMAFLKPYNAITQLGPKTYRIERPISLEGNIRLDVTGDTVTRLELRSAPNNATCLCLDEAAALLKDVEVTSYDPVTGGPDKTYADERSFVRAKNGRLDAINVNFNYLGTSLELADDANQTRALLREGGMYGVSWRISDDLWGKEIATGWVERSTFMHNHFGAFTYGASGMAWLNSYFGRNDVYGLDPHDDSNNALVENNVFAYNGKHGFIVSKRCNYNIIRNNTSIGNKLHGFMLHQDSDYNVIENNVSYDNTDNYVIYASDYNTIRNNRSYNARASHIRINEGSRNNYVTGNDMQGGRRGVFVYGNSSNLYVSNNTAHVGREVLTTQGATGVLFAGNTIDGLHYKIGNGDRLIFGPNTITQEPAAVPKSAPLPNGFTLDVR